MTAATVTAAPGQLRPSAAVRGRGWLTLEKPAAPAANANFIYPIEATFWKRLLSMAATLTTSAVAGTRQLALNYCDGDGYIFNQVPLVGAIGPSQAISVYADQATVTPVSESPSFENEGNQTSPAALTTIASIALPSGTWTVAWSVMVSGTVGATEVNNFGLVQGAAQLLVSENGNAVAVPYAQETVEIVVPIGGQTVLVRSIAAGTAASVYSAQITATPVNPFGGQAQIPDFVLKSGWQLQLVLSGGQAGDQISGLGLLTERYPSSDIELGHRHYADELAELLLRMAAGG